MYQVRRGAPNGLENTGIGGETQDIGILSNGFADAAAQIAFCADQTCTVSVLYDQSGQGNNLTVAKAGCYGCDFTPPDTACTDDFESVATAASLWAALDSYWGTDGPLPDDRLESWLLARTGVRSAAPERSIDRPTPRAPTRHLAALRNILWTYA